MAAVFGKCKLCPKNSPDKRLYADGVCSYHLAHRGDDQSSHKFQEDVRKNHEKEVVAAFFRDMVKLTPPYCENCGNKIITASWPASSAVCHIIPKRHFKSVMIHPSNIWFGCMDCHHNYDDKGWTSAVTMHIWPICVERFKEFMHLIKDSEMRHLPAPLRDLVKPIM